MIVPWLQKAKKPLIVVLGPTSSGKTDYSIRLAQRLNAIYSTPETAISDRRAATRRRSSENVYGSTEIINADSRQIYQYLDIGTAKITQAEMQDVSHHLFSVLDPKEKLTVAWYKKEATRMIDEIQSRGHVPMLVGGSMLYISAVIDNFELAPVASPELRAKLEEEYDKDAGETLFKRLQELDPDAAASFAKENKRYVIRALEMFETTGKPKQKGIVNPKSEYDLFLIGMDVPREVLHERIAVRAEKMIEAGWIDEVKGLLQKGYTAEDPGMESHGYYEIIQLLEGKMSQEEAKKRIIEQTRQYVKRQTTWWRKDERIHWIAPSSSI